MKKIFAISLIAMTAVTAANAEIASKAYVNQQDEAIDAKITTLNGNASTPGSVAEKIATALQAYTTTGNDTNYVSTVTTATGEGSNGNVVTAVSANTNGTVTVTKGITALTATDIANMVTHNGAVGNATTPVYVDANGVVTAGTELGTASQATLETTEVTVNGTTVPTTGQVATYVTSAISNLNSGNTYELQANKTTTLDSNSTATQYPAASTVYTALTGKQDVIDSAHKLDVANIDTANYATSGLKTTLDGAYDPLNAASTAIEALNDTSGAAQTGKWVTAVTQTDGKISATMGDPLAGFDKLTTNQGDGKYALTAVVTNNAITGYAWELIERATPAEEP